jgi:hypothetical protein
MVASLVGVRCGQRAWDADLSPHANASRLHLIMAQKVLAMSAMP